MQIPHEKSSQIPADYGSRIRHLGACIRTDEKSLNYGQLNAALVGAVKSLESQDRVGDKGKMDCAWRMEREEGDQNGPEKRWGGKF